MADAIGDRRVRVSALARRAGQFRHTTGRMYFVPEGQHDRSRPRSAWLWSLDIPAFNAVAVPVCPGGMIEISTAKNPP
jgi:hypothetical protein